MSTQIKRLYQSNTEFVPITLSEAVVVNTSNIPGLASLGITTLDKVLRTTMGVVGTNASNISTLQTAVNNINAALENKQDKLTAGAGITITSDGVISVTANAELYKIVTSLPTASKSCENTIYLVPSSGTLGNLFTEYLCVYEPTQSQYIWEKIGTLSTDVDLSNYVTKDEFDIVKGQLANTITAQNVTTSGGSQVVVSYEIPTTLYDSAVSTDTSDQIVSG